MNIRLAAIKAKENLTSFLEAEMELTDHDFWEGSIITYDLNPHLEVGIEDNGLRGVYVNKNLPKGIIIGEYIGEELKTKQEVWNRLKGNNNTYMVQVHKKLWIDGEFKGNILSLINHSCHNNNCKLIRLSPTKVGIILIQDINENEFLHFNYQC